MLSFFSFSFLSRSSLSISPSFNPTHPITEQKSADAYSYSYTNTYSYANTYSYTNTDAYSYSNTNTYSDAYSYSYTNTYSDGTGDVGISVNLSRAARFILEIHGDRPGDPALRHRVRTNYRRSLR